MAYSEGTTQTGPFRDNIASILTTPLGETNACTEFSVGVSGGQNAVKLIMPTLSGGKNPSGWMIYRGASSGSEQLLASIPGDINTFIDDGSYTPTTTIPGSGYGNIAALPLNISQPSSSATSTPWVAQQFTVHNGSDTIAYDNVLAQAFMPNCKTLSGFDLPLSVHNAPSGNVVLQIFNATNNPLNVPNSHSPAVALASASVAIGSVQDFTGAGLYTNFTFGTPLTVVPGNVYYFVLSLDNSASTVASTNFVQIAGRTGSGNTALTTLFNSYFSGNRSVAFTTGTWTASSANTGLNYKLYANGTLTAGTYYYKITAATGWCSKATRSVYYETTQTYKNKTQVLFSSGAQNTESIYITVGQNGADGLQNITCGILESYDTDNHLLYNISLSPYTNGTQVTSNSKTYNFRTSIISLNTGVVSSTTNATYRIHNFLDHAFLSIVGDSTITGWEENALFFGRITSLSASDNCYIISAPGGVSSFTALWPVLRDASGNVNVNATCYFPIASSGTNIATGLVQDAFNYANTYTNNYDGIKLYIGDSNGIRGYIPDVLLYPSTITNVLNNHDTFTVGSLTYKFYVLATANQYAFSYYQLINSAALEFKFYPAANMS